MRNLLVRKINNLIICSAVVGACAHAGLRAQTPGEAAFDAHYVQQTVINNDNVSAEDFLRGLDESGKNDLTPAQLDDVIERYESMGAVQGLAQTVERREAGTEPVRIDIFLEPKYHSKRNDLNLQFMVIWIEGKIQKVFLTSGARPGYETPRGYFGVHEKIIDAKSATYDDAPMPYSHFFYAGGNYAIHGVTPDEYAYLGFPASHGCVRLYTPNAQWLWEQTNHYGRSHAIVHIFEEMPYMTDERIDELYGYLVRDNPYLDVRAQSRVVMRIGGKVINGGGNDPANRSDANKPASKPGPKIDLNPFHWFHKT